MIYRVLKAADVIFAEWEKMQGSIKSGFISRIRHEFCIRKFIKARKMYVDGIHDPKWSGLLLPVYVVFPEYRLNRKTEVLQELHSYEEKFLQFIEGVPAPIRQSIFEAYPVPEWYEILTKNKNKD